MLAGSRPGGVPSQPQREHWEEGQGPTPLFQLVALQPPLCAVPLPPPALSHTLPRLESKMGARVHATLRFWGAAGPPEMELELLREFLPGASEPL